MKLDTKRFAELVRAVKEHGVDEVKVESQSNLPPEEEAAARLDGSFDPSKLIVHLTVQPVKPLEFLKMTFEISPEKKDG